MSIQNIKKKIKVFDLETTGLDKNKDHIIQFAGITYDPQTKKIVDKLDLLIRPEGNYSITLAAYYKHKITPKILEDKPTFREVSEKILDFFKGDDFVVLTYNGLSFDLSFLSNQFSRIGIDFSLLDKELYDAFLIEKKKYDLSLEGRFKHYFGTSMEDKGLVAHNALSDIKATLMLFTKQCEDESNLIPEEVLTECNTIKNIEFEGKTMPGFSIGKYRSLPLELVYNIDKKYLDWILSDSCAFSPSCKKYVKNFIKEKE